MVRGETRPSPELLGGVLLAGAALLWTAAALGVGPSGLAWTFDRLAGVVGYAALAAAVAVGALLGSRYVPPRLARPLQFGWHGVLSGFALALVAAHVAFTLVDAEHPQTVAGVLVPGLATYAPGALAAGTLAMHALAAVYLSFARRRTLPLRLWRGLHLLAYPAFALATLHGVLAGSDDLGWLYLPALSAVSAATALRFLERRKLLA